MPARLDLPDDRLLVDVSLWSADLSSLGAEVDRIAPYADLFHFDVTDGRLVPGLLFFPDLVAALRTRTRVPFHVHLMAAEPVDLVVAFADAGADLITVHVEAGEQVPAALDAIHSYGKAAGLALTLDTDVAKASPYLDVVEAIVMIGTPLGTKGTTLTEGASPRIAAMRRMLRRHRVDRSVRIIADGGIRRHTIGPLARAGADGVVAGSFLFGSDDPGATAAWMQSHSPGRTVWRRAG
jgi:ribulose-phosphate 3-epimerase